MADEGGDDRRDSIARSRRFSRRNLLRRLTGRTEDRPGASGLGFDADERQADRLVREGRYAEALVRYQRVVEREPRHREALRYAGWCLWKLQRHGEARSRWRTLLGVYPHDQTARLYIGLSYASQQRMDEAVAEWCEYRDYGKVHVMRQVNLVLFDHAEGESLDAASVVRRIENAIEAQARNRE